MIQLNNSKKKISFDEKKAYCVGLRSGWDILSIDKLTYEKILQLNYD